MNKLLKVIGLMSGTSLDGLDIALVEIYETRGRLKIKNTHFSTYSFDNEIKERILKNINPETAKLDEISDLNFALGNLFADYVLQFLETNNLSKSEIDLIGSHGQTFYHSIKNGLATSTLQLGEPAIIALKTGITTVGDFRPFDIAVKGQGAPLVPFLDYVLFKDYKKSFALQNIGGIANFSYLPKEHTLENMIAFDTGPGNMIIDSLMKIITNNKVSYDENGSFAKKGQVNESLLKELLDNPYFDLKPPKSTGRELFGEQYSKELFAKAEKANLSHEDLIATVTYFTAKTIYDSYKNFLPTFPDEIVVSGGGVKNETLLSYLKELFPKTTEISSIDKYGILADAKEAVAFAVMAYCNVFGLPNNLKQATGAIEEVVMGKICPSKNYRSLFLCSRKTSTKNFETTETRNLLSEELDELTPLEIVELMNKADYDVVEAVEEAKTSIAIVLQEIINSLGNGGKLFYIGAGTSGRLGVLDASECPPTFKTSPELVQGIIAGGEKALVSAVEGAEDDGTKGRADIRSKICEKDILIGISANGKAPYIIEALAEAKTIGAKTALITCNNIEKEAFIDNLVVLLVGAEILSGSSRLKAGTATKMVLNIFTTGAFSKLGKVYSNYMVDLNVSNKKLKRRAINILKDLTNISDIEADELLVKAEGSVKLALLMKIKAIDVEKAKELLAQNKGFLRKALN